MDELVSTIRCLCKVLNNLIDISIKPEFFRLSKINKLDIEEAKKFWNILHHLCCFSTTEQCKNDAVKCISRYLMIEGTVVGYILSLDATPRQLLLCFGWLLSRGILESIIDKIILDSPLGKELPLEPSGSEDLLRPGENRPDNLPKYALYLSGLIQHNMKAIANYRQERASLFTKLHKATAGVGGLPHLSVGDVNLISQPGLLRDFLAQCHRCTSVLETYTKWQKKSSVFWLWMDSVLKEEESSDISKQLSVKELHHLNEFSKLLENNVRRIARLEDENIVQEKLEFFFSGKMQLSEDIKFLEKVVNLLDLKIEVLSKMCEKKKQELLVKLSRIENLHELSDEINTVLKTFGFSIQQNSQPQSTNQLSQTSEQELAKLSLTQS